MRTIAVVNQTGGSGKTTTAVNLAACLTELGKKTLLIDLDPQASATYWSGINETLRGTYELLADSRAIQDVVQGWGDQGIDIVPSSIQLLGLEKIMAGREGAYHTLRNHIDGSPKRRWHYVFLDCPSSLGSLTVNALAAADSIIIPVETHALGLQGLAQLVSFFKSMTRDLGKEIKVLGILACRMKLRTRHAQEVMRSLQEHFGESVFSVFVRENIRLAESPSWNQPIIRYDGRSTGAEDYRALARNFLKNEDLARALTLSFD